MAQNPFFLLGCSVLIVSSILLLAKCEKAQFLFKFFPEPLWCYFVSTLLSSWGILPQQSPFYGKMSQFILPGCLFLLLLGTDIPFLLRASKKALLAMVIGSIGILLGGAVTFGVMRLYPAWTEGFPLDALGKGWGSLAATWTGGSANMISVKEILQTPENVFSILILVDAIVAYSCMATLIYISQYQKRVDQWLGAENTEALKMVENSTVTKKIEMRFHKKMLVRSFLTICALALGALFSSIAVYLPSLGGAFNAATWTITLSMFLALFLSLTPARKLESLGASSTGNFLLYLLLTTIGARASFSALGSAPAFIVLGAVWLLIHWTILLIGGRLFRLPLGLLAISSQANVGGTVSAPIVAGIYREGLAPVGLILAILGNIFGVYLGLFMAKICNWLAIVL